MAYDRDAMDYHAKGRPGKLEVVATKPLLTQRDLSMAYTPGVADPCRAIAAEPDDQSEASHRLQTRHRLGRGEAAPSSGPSHTTAATTAPNRYTKPLSEKA